MWQKLDLEHGKNVGWLITINKPNYLTIFLYLGHAMG
jgi:hypothetical protein